MNDNNKNISQARNKLIVHYYLNDNSHSMNAFVRNSIEKDFLNIVSVVCAVLDVEIKLESKVPEKGGYIEILEVIEKYPTASSISAATIGYVANKIVELIKHICSGAYKKNRLEVKKLELEIAELKNKSNKNDISQDINLEQKIARPLSNYYSKLEKYEKIQKVGFGSEVKKETIIERVEFKNFIINDGKELEEDDDAVIELISPVLKEGKYKWKGIYKNEKIDFSMGDSKFKNDVIDSKYDFGNGSFINCHLEIVKTYDDFGEESKARLYRVVKVYEIKKDAFDEWKIRKAGIKKRKKKFDEKVKSLFLECSDLKDLK
ncbi:hypothetical protein [Campylobacter sp. RM16187]|uniref:hypothetical protein n=1 Tax=Campylobacter sp. RM16187 TaxID=1660063 RepID=UPI0021B5CF76|nr:hypothetical protein [Campylobacter sp. RM16187]QKG29807.1 hypothetical protein CDOMF_1573 [Campylobacter sp. RM16187]